LEERALADLKTRLARLLAAAKAVLRMEERALADLAAAVAECEKP
jgi:hypothetical protein